MKLKALEMQGFKSFPDKTRLSFENGITVIVGPNGSGKSNITDAVRWVLGEMSTKSIRGSKMEDVIFGGSDNRRPMNYAEVTLYIDNTQGLGRLDSEYDEVSVTRRYFRGGDSEYLINGQKSRLKDIAELFMNTGVGKTGYSNIGQGKIAEIISQKSDERRSVFEEAAGISKYRIRKTEAERKLKETEANLLRIGDMLSDLGTRVGPLEKEAAAARKYLDLHEQKKQVDVSIWLYDAENMRETANETERLYTAAKIALEETDSEISSCNNRSESLYVRAAELQQSAGDVSEKITSAIKEKSNIESAGKVLENDIGHIEDRILQIKREQETRRSALSDGKTSVERSNVSIREKTDELEKLNGRIDEKAALLTEQEELCVLLDEKVLDADDERRLADAELTTLKVRLSSLEGSHGADTGRKNDIEEQIASAEEILAELNDAGKRLTSDVEGFNAKIEEERNRLDELKEALSEAENTVDSVSGELSACSVSIEAKNQRAEALKRMDELLEGYNYSVKNVMHASSNGAVSGICGPVSRLLNVKKEYSIAVETALGANIQNIVVEDENSAKAAIAYLKRTGGGRATFYPITSVRSRTPAVPADKLSAHRGYVGMADTLCTYDKKYSEIVGYLLGGTAVFDTLDNASYSAKAFGYRLRIVTLDGQLINAGGSFTGGSVKTDSGILTRSAEISSINDEITRLEINEKALKNKLSAAKEAYSDTENAAAECENRISLLRTVCGSSVTELEVTKAKIASQNEKIASLRGELEDLGAEASRFDSERAECARAIGEAENALSEAERKLEDLRVKAAEADDGKLDLSTAIGKLRISAATLSAELEALRDSVALGEGTLAALTSQISQSDEFIKTLENKLVETRAKISEQSGHTTEINEKIKSLEEERRRLGEQNVAFEKKQTAIRDELRELTSKRDTVYREYTKLESKRENLTAEHDRLAAKIWEDYELTYSSALDLGYPAITEETRPETVRRQNELRGKLRALGSVNVGAIEEFADVKQRYEFNKAQYDDLTSSQESLGGIIERLEREMRTKFVTAFDEINRNFKITFKELFGGGSAEIALSDPEDVLSSGIEINVAPPGKIIKNLISLSGGEQSFVAIALIFAILNVNPTPFCIFDEIESALDEVNVIRLAEYMRHYSEKTQFVVITHRRGTMEASDMLYGITMPDRGISKVLSMNIGEVEQKIGEKYT